MTRKRDNGEGSIYKRKDGRWVGQYLVYLPSGPKYRYIYAKTRKEAAEKLTKAMADRNGGIVFDDENLSVSDFLEVWLSDCVKDTIRVSTFERYKGIANLHISPALGRIRLKALTTCPRAGFLPRQAGFWPLSRNGAEDPRRTAQGALAGCEVVPRASQRDGCRECSVAQSQGDAPALSGRDQEAPRDGRRRSSRGPLGARGAYGHETGRALGAEVDGRGSGGR